MQPEPPRAEPTNVLGIFGLHYSTREHHIKDEFGKHGAIDTVVLIQDRRTGDSKGYAFLYFTSVDEATKAKEATQDLVMMGRKIRVDYSVTQKAHEPTPGKYMGAPQYVCVSRCPFTLPLLTRDVSIKPNEESRGFPRLLPLRSAAIPPLALSLSLEIPAPQKIFSLPLEIPAPQKILSLSFEISSSLPQPKPLSLSRSQTLKQLCPHHQPFLVLSIPPSDSSRINKPANREN